MISRVPMASSHNTGTRARIPKSLSVNSLDFVTAATNLPSLMSESVTLSSLSSISSDVLPAFYPRKPPSFRLVGLGDHLKLFSSAVDNSFRNVIITSPTGPRLKSMLKECLSIDKWAKHSGGWSAPGHVAWESEEDSRLRCWAPEGPAMIPRAPKLGSLQSRSSLELSQLSLDSNFCTPAYSDLDDDLVKMMMELKSMRSYFQESTDSSSLSPSTSSSLELSTKKPSLPSLVVSNSNFTFPLSLASSLSLSGSMTIASRRGKVAPPPLVLKKEAKSDIPYPGIPTAFLGSPSRYESILESENQENKSDLCLEDMINNLRLQCSTMALRTPLMDSDRSWNSRSYLDPKKDQKLREDLPDTKSSDGDEWAFANTLIKEPLCKPQLKATMVPSYMHRRRVPPIYCPTQDRKDEILQMGVDSLTSIGVNESSTTEASVHSRNIPACPLEVAQNTQRVPLLTSRPSPPLRSAMVKQPASRPRKSLKCVRFILKHQVIEPKEPPDTIVSTAAKNNNGKVGATKGQVHALAKPSIAKPISLPSAPLPFISSQKTKPSIAIKRSPSTMPTNSRVRAATISSPLRHSVLQKPSEAEEPKLGTGDSTQSSRRSVQSLGRQSLSRIMKAPMFNMKESPARRATISSRLSLANEVAVDENAARRDSTTESFQKKSRMPVPLRNILTRFK